MLALLEDPPPADAPKTLVGFLEEPLASRTPLDSLKPNLVTFISEVILGEVFLPLAFHFFAFLTGFRPFRPQQDI